MTFNFDSTKKDILNKKDKSNIGFIDDKISKLCSLINSRENYFSTSSCSGRITLVLDEDKKTKNVFLYRTHEKINFNNLKESLFEVSKKLKRGIIFFKQEPCFIVISCRNKESQWKLFSSARNNGWKKSGILSIDKKLLVELMSDERIEFPVIKDGEILIEEKLMNLIIEKANKNLEKGWAKIKFLEKLIILT